MATRSSILTWKIPRTEELGGLQSMGLQRAGHSLAAEHARMHRHNSGRALDEFSSCREQCVACGARCRRVCCSSSSLMRICLYLLLVLHLPERRVWKVVFFRDSYSSISYVTCSSALPYYTQEGPSKHLALKANRLASRRSTRL